MLAAGATTAWETFPKALAGERLTRSFCHGWSAAPAYFLPRWVLGVRPRVPGCSAIVVDPAIDSVGAASGQVPLPQGDVGIAWSRDQAGRDLDLTIPPGVTAYLPSAFQAWTVREGSAEVAADAVVVRGRARLRQALDAHLL
jgi:alpha-L-rhamnosidase